MIRSRLFIAFTLVELTFLAVLLLHGRLVSAAREGTSEHNRQVAQVLQLTDFALWTEARYTRHPSQADLFTPFQDGPAAFEHFPAGSIIGPPMRR